MRRCRVMSVVLVGTAVVLAACSSSSKSSTSTTTASGANSSTTSSASGGSSSASTAITTSGSAATATLAVRTNAGKQIIVTASGKTVYLYVPNGTSTTSKVPASLKAAWPAVTVSGAAAVGAALDKAKIAVVTQPDGTKQASYNGHLLYTFSGDAGPGTASGEGLGGIWFVLSPAGAKA